jgi:myo-inositol-1(or 4)-monophosphatase
MAYQLHPLLNTAIQAARAAGKIINRAALDLASVSVSQKQVNDYVTDVDEKAEAVIIGTLLQAYPQHGIWAEESGRTQGQKNAAYVWIIDPLDGTTNFIHGFPVYCVSIALQIEGKIEHALVFDPTRNDLFIASKGRGAYLNNQRLRVSSRSRLSESLVATGFALRPGQNLSAYQALLANVTGKVAGVRRPGAAALDLAYVAAGYTDAFFEPGLQAWDVAAGSLLVTEAGGLVGNFTGEGPFLESQECLAANPKIYGQLLPLLSQFSKVGKEVKPSE